MRQLQLIDIIEIVEIALELLREVAFTTGRER
jgi:hypothetical protein